MRLIIVIIISLCCAWSAGAKIGGWNSIPNTQYHIQTDEGPERYFRYQTMSGQYRKEKRLQDGTVVGSYGWVDANGFLRLRDYVADDKGYRILSTKMVRVGVDRQTDDNTVSTKLITSHDAVGSHEYTQQLNGVQPAANSPLLQTVTNRPIPPPISLSDYLKEKQYENTTPSPLGIYFKTPLVEITNNGLPSTTPAPSTSFIQPEVNTATPPFSIQQGEYQQSTSIPSSYYASTTPANYIRPQTFRPYYNPNAIAYNEEEYKNNIGTSQNDNAQYDGVAFTHNGFRYYLPRHYHEETNLSGDQRAGSFGYIDPFGIRRVIYYNTSPNGGFIHRKNNKYVGFQATPYD